MIKFWHDRSGSVLIEYTIVFPLLVLTMLGTVDVANMLFQWAEANKAAYVGVRTAIVSNPIAELLTDDNTLYTSTQRTQDLGKFCFDFDTGKSNGSCPSSITVQCGSASCTPNTYGFNSAAFTNAYGTGIFDRMKAIFPQLQPENVLVTYELNGGGYVGREGGLSMNVTVQIQNVPVQFYFLPGIMPYFGGLFPSQINIPSFASTLTSEDMCSGTLPNCDLSGQQT
jgi:hypothetical protein